MRWFALPLSLLTACGPAPYAAFGIVEAGDLDPRAVRTLGCLDVGAAVLAPAHDGDAALLLLRVGNRCLHPERFDLRAARFYGVTGEGETRPLLPVDPRGELVALQVDAATNGREKIRLRGPEPGVMRRVCVDFGRTVPSAGVVEAATCFEDTGLAWEVRR